MITNYLVCTRRCSFDGISSSRSLLLCYASCKQLEDKEHLLTESRILPLLISSCIFFRFIFLKYRGYNITQSLDFYQMVDFIRFSYEFLIRRRLIASSVQPKGSFTYYAINFWNIFTPSPPP